MFMNSRFTLFAMIALAVAVVAGLPSFAGIQGSAHDFTGNAWSGNEICAPCHIPHNASKDAALWARGSLSDLGPYELWDGEDDVLGKRSLTCLSCHDGTLALGGITGSKMGDESPSADLGTDLTDDHPIGVAYTMTASTRWGAAVPNSSGTSAKVGGTSGLSIYNNGDGKYRVECSSCHSVHGSDFGGLLRMSNYGSALCLACHIR
jgi:predicted CXXCH cytochrome family protein